MRSTIDGRIILGSIKSCPNRLWYQEVTDHVPIVADLVYVDTMIEEKLSFKPISDFVQTCDIVGFNNIWRFASRKVLCYYLTLRMDHLVLWTEALLLCTTIDLVKLYEFQSNCFIVLYLINLVLSCLRFFFLWYIYQVIWAPRGTHLVLPSGLTWKHTTLFDSSLEYFLDRSYVTSHHVNHLGRSQKFTLAEAQVQTDQIAII